MASQELDSNLMSYFLIRSPNKQITRLIRVLCIWETELKRTKPIIVSCSFLVTYSQCLMFAFITQEYLMQWSLNKMADILATAFSNQISWLKIAVLWFNFIEVCCCGSNWQKAALVQVMAWLLFGAKPLNEAMMTKISNAIRRYQATMS